MPPAPKVLSPSERLAALETQGGVKKKGLLRRVAEFGEKPLWEAPQRWGQEFSDYLTEGDQGTSLMDSPYERAMRKVKEAAAATSRVAGSTVSGFTSPTSVALTAGTLGLATPEIAGANVARGTAMALKGAGALQAAHGAYKTGKGIYEGDTGEAVSGGLETGMGLLGARARIPEKPPALPISRIPGQFEAATGVPGVPPGSPLGGGMQIPSRPTATYPPPSPETILRGQSTPRPTAYTRALGPAEGVPFSGPAPPPGPRFTAGQFGVADRGLGPVGVVERGSVTSGPPQGLGPVSAGMNRPGPGQAAFEAMVPDRFKSSPIPPVDPTGLNMNLRGEAPPAPTPGLRTMGPTGKLQAPKGTVGLKQMVDKYGLEEAAARAQMTPDEVVAELAPKPKAAPKKAPAPPKPAAKKVEPKVEVETKAAPAEKIAPPAKGEVRMFEKSPVETLNALAKRGNKHAIRELELRSDLGDVAATEGLDKVAGATKKLPSKKRAGLLESETGAVGPNIDPIIERQAEVRRARSRPEAASARAAGRGVVSPTKFGKAADVAEEVARTAMLSGLAVPKSVLGNIGSFPLAAMETKSTAPLKELFNFPEHGRNVVKGWKAGADPEVYGPMSKINFIGRGMGALDYASEQGLIRSGVSPQRAKELLLTNPNPVSTDPKLNTRFGRFLVPFKTIPYNAFREGVSRYEQHPRIAAGAALAGLGAGALTNDPKDISLGAAAMGPYSVPYLAGASVNAGARALQGISPIPEWSITKSLTKPQERVTKPAGLGWFDSGKAEKKGKRRDLGPSDTKGQTKRRKLGPKD